MILACALDSILSQGKNNQNKLHINLRGSNSNFLPELDFQLISIFLYAYMSQYPQQVLIAFEMIFKNPLVGLNEILNQQLRKKKKGKFSLA